MHHTSLRFIHAELDPVHLNRVFPENFFNSDLEVKERRVTFVFQNLTVLDQNPNMIYRCKELHEMVKTHETISTFLMLFLSKYYTNVYLNYLTFCLRK